MHRIPHNRNPNLLNNLSRNLRWHSPYVDNIHTCSQHIPNPHMDNRPICSKSHASPDPCICNSPYARHKPCIYRNRLECPCNQPSNSDGNGKKRHSLIKKAFHQNGMVNGCRTTNAISSMPSNDSSTGTENSKDVPAGANSGWPCCSSFLSAPSHSFFHHSEHSLERYGRCPFWYHS